MPYAPKKACPQPGCPNLVSSGRCSKHKRPRYSKPRPSASQRGYGWKWQKARKAYLAAHPVCVDPYGRHEGRPTPATVVDHVEPHRGDMELFWDMDNWAALCFACHQSKTARGM